MFYIFHPEALKLGSPKNLIISLLFLKNTNILALEVTFLRNFEAKNFKIYNTFFYLEIQHLSTEKLSFYDLRFLSYRGYSNKQAENK